MLTHSIVLDLVNRNLDRYGGAFLMQLITKLFTIKLLMISRMIINDGIQMIRL